MIIEAKKKLGKIERTERRREAELVSANEERKEKDSLRSENEFLVIKLGQELGCLKLGEEVNVEELTEALDSVCSLLDVYLQVHRQLKLVFKNYDVEFTETFKDMSQRVNESVLDGKRVIREIKWQQGENELRVINEQVQATNNRVYQEQMVYSEKMSWEIELCCASLISKCRISLDEL